jgi:hypothetical protein
MSPLTNTENDSALVLSFSPCSICMCDTGATRRVKYMCDLHWRGEWGRQRGRICLGAGQGQNVEHIYIRYICTLLHMYAIKG